MGTIALRWTPILLFFYNLSVYAILRWLSPHLLTGGDAARLGIHAWDFLTRQVWSFYIYHLYAPNPLIVFLHTLAFAVFGVTLDALNGVTVGIGVLTGVTAYQAGYSLFRDDDLTTAYRAGLIAGISFPLTTIVVAFMMGGTEHTLLPLFALAVVAALWRGLRSGQSSHFAIAGALLGLSQYSYIVARALPVALLAALGLLAIFYPSYRQRWRGVLLLFGICALVAAPQWVFFIHAPAAFFARTGQNAGQFILNQPDFLPLIGAKFINQLRMLGWAWENGYNLSGRALLTPPLLIGLLLAIRRRPACFFTGVMALAFLGLELITYESVTVSATRLMGAIPFLLLLSGYGVARLWGWLEQISPKLGWLAIGLVVVFGVERHVDMLTRVIPAYLGSPGVEWQASLVDNAEAAYINQHSDEAILLASSEYQRAPLAFLLAEEYPERASGLNPPLGVGERVKVILPDAPNRPTTDGQPANYVPDTWVLAKGGVIYFLPTIPDGVALGDSAEVLYAHNGLPAARVMEGVWRGKSAPFSASTIGFDNGLELVGYNVTELSAGTALDVNLFWRARRPLPVDVQIFTQLLDKDGGKLAGIHDWVLHGVYRARAWRTGEVIPLTYRFAIPSDAAPGGYRLVVGVTDIETGKNVPTVRGDDLGVAARLKIPLPATVATPARASAAAVGVLVLEGYTLVPGPGQLRAQFFWRATHAPDFDYTFFLHLNDAQGNLSAQADGEPYGGRYPTSLWAVGERVMDERDLPVPPGEYQLFVGWYRWDTGERLPVTLDGVRLPDGRVPLGKIVIP